MSRFVGYIVKPNVAVAWAPVLEQARDKTVGAIDPEILESIAELSAFRREILAARAARPEVVSTEPVDTYSVGRLTHDTVQTETEEITVAEFVRRTGRKRSSVYRSVERGRLAHRVDPDRGTLVIVPVASQEGAA